MREVLSLTPRSLAKILCQVETDAKLYFYTRIKYGLHGCYGISVMDLFNARTYFFNYDGGGKPYAFEAKSCEEIEAAIKEYRRRHGIKTMIAYQDELNDLLKGA